MMDHLSLLQNRLTSYREAAQTEREKRNYFEELVRTYLRHEPTNADLHSDVWLQTESDVFLIREEAKISLGKIQDAQN